MCEAQQQVCCVRQSPLEDEQQVGCGVLVTGDGGTGQGRGSLLAQSLGVLGTSVCGMWEYAAPSGPKSDPTVPMALDAPLPPNPASTLPPSSQGQPQGPSLYIPGLPEQPCLTPSCLLLLLNGSLQPSPPPAKAPAVPLPWGRATPIIGTFSSSGQSLGTGSSPPFTPGLAQCARQSPTHIPQGPSVRTLPLGGQCCHPTPTAQSKAQ